MIKEAIDRILALSPPTISTFGDLKYSDKGLNLICPPTPNAVECSTLQGLVDLFLEELDDMKPEEVLVHITSPISVEIISKDADDCGRRRVWATAEYPECSTFKFGAWMDPETFIIAAQQGFQRVKIEADDGSFMLDLDYILEIASKITAEQSTSNDDDGFSQRVAVKQGIALKAETIQIGRAHV